MMKFCVFITLTLLSSQFCVGISQVVESRCPENFRYDEVSRTCVQICTEKDAPCNNGTDVVYQLIKSSSPEMNLAVTESDEPNVQFKLPACKLATFSGAEITNMVNGTITVTIGRAEPVVFDRFQTSTDNASVTACYPLSPQLLQCQLKRLNMANYTWITNRALQNIITNDTIGFRDYYTGNNSGDPVLGCTEPINQARRLRCNYLIYKQDEYKWIDNTNTTLLLLPTSETIYRPQFVEVPDSPGDISLCYPASPKFTMCQPLWLLDKNEYVIRPDHKIFSSGQNRVYELGDFFFQADKKAVVCAVITPKPTFDYFQIHASLFVISAVCLLVAFILHLLIPSLNYHAKPLLCHMASMMTLYIGLAIRKFMVRIPEGPCYTLFVIIYVSALASFCWLSVLAFDLWSIFANMQTSSRIGCRPWACGSKKKRFYYFSIYAWGLPVLLCILTIILDTSPSLQDGMSLYPNISKMCWFNNRKVAYLFLYGPLFTMLAINFTLFILTVANLRRASKGVEVVNKKLNKQLLFVCIRLFIVMGLCWIVEAITWTLNLDAEAQYVPDVIIAVQGIIIFIIYICKPTTYRLIRRKFTSDRQRSSDTRWTTDGQHSKSNAEQRSSSGAISLKSTKDEPQPTK